MTKPIFVARPHLPPLDEYLTHLRRIWDSGQLTNNGPLVQELERNLAEFLGVSYLLFVTNGTIALQLALRALEVSGEVITTPFSYVATASSILWEHCTPVFVDVDADTFCIDPKLVSNAITPRTRAIMATHVYGYPCDVLGLGALAKTANLKVIYDGAHAFHTRIHDSSLLAFGDITTLSFHATKLFHSVEGGAVICRDAAVARQIELLRSFGHIGDEHYCLGVNGKNSEFHAAMGLCMLPRVPALIEARKQLCAKYDAQLAGLGIRRVPSSPGLAYNYAYYPIVLPSEQAMFNVRDNLAKYQIHARRYFYPSLNTLPYVAGAPCPVAEDLARRVLCLPLYAELEPAAVDRISELVVATLR